MGEKEALEFDELSDEDVADINVDPSLDENIIELVDVVEDAKSPSTSVDGGGQDSRLEPYEVLIDDQDLELDTDLEVALEGLELSEEDEAPVTVGSESDLEGLEEAALEFEALHEAEEPELLDDSEESEAVEIESVEPVTLEGLEKAADELAGIVAIEESEGMGKAEEEELSLDNGLELPDVDLSEVMSDSDDEKPGSEEIMDSPIEEGLPGISDERLEAVLTSIVEEVLERVARETMERVAEKVITEAIESLKQSFEIPAD
ncbi:MAG: hypothetical protein V2J25_00085 [Desulfatiglans sp.]|nr:hypothetical protein [Thermodesulfobacteriota bacterium]MEE4351241.1 hypothetical protein [Desulfatiglans sp.]